MLDNQRQRLADHVERMGSVEGLLAVRDAQFGELEAEERSFIARSNAWSAVTSMSPFRKGVPNSILTQ
ncbi:MAG: hypothetical protein NTW96_02255 [Planctomycetia bacterium]|nr:hypothetical protein [Planctomycetia bacterium]